ncbi:MAG: hypothetical protein U5K51_03490 [Flavobacteriaceae bacterium]|nr:hypothetical protein [Flavobacteriaceae bacterium]
MKPKVLNKNTEKQQDWEIIFDGKTFAGWRGYGLQEAPEEWKIVRCAPGLFTQPGTQVGY